MITVNDKKFLRFAKEMLLDFQNVPIDLVSAEYVHEIYGDLMKALKSVLANKKIGTWELVIIYPYLHHSILRSSGALYSETHAKVYKEWVYMKQWIDNNYPTKIYMV